MPTPDTWTCVFCRAFTHADHHVVELHEQDHCFHNPANRGCQTCANADRRALLGHCRLKPWLGSLYGGFDQQRNCREWEVK